MSDARTRLFFCFYYLVGHVICVKNAGIFCFYYRSHELAFNMDERSFSLYQSRNHLCFYATRRCLNYHTLFTDQRWILRTWIYSVRKSSSFRDCSDYRWMILFFRAVFFLLRWRKPCEKEKGVHQYAEVCFIDFHKEILTNEFFNRLKFNRKPSTLPF